VKHAQFDSPIVTHFSSVYFISYEVEDHLVLAWADKTFITPSNHMFLFHFICRFAPELIIILKTSHTYFCGSNIYLSKNTELKIKLVITEIIIN